MGKTQRYFLADNESGDKYAVPVERLKDWCDWLYGEDWDAGVTPDWAIYLDGHWTFTDPRKEVRVKSA